MNVAESKVIDGQSDVARKAILDLVELELSLLGGGIGEVVVG